CMHARELLDKILTSYSVGRYCKKHNIDKKTKTSLLNEGTNYFYFVIRFIAVCSIFVFLADILNLLFTHPFYDALDKVDLIGHIFIFSSHCLFFLCSILFFVLSMFKHGDKYKHNTVVCYYFTLLLSIIIFKVGLAIDSDSANSVFYSGYIILAILAAFPLLSTWPFAIYSYVFFITFLVFSLPIFQSTFEYQEVIISLALIITSSFFRTHYFVNFYKKFELEQKNCALSLEAKTDILTNAFNRRALNSFAETEVAPLKGSDDLISILFFDIDDFKIYNDKYSYEIGDEVLKKVSNTIKDLITDNENIHFFRFGGDEFVLVFVNLDESFIRFFISHFLKTIRKIKLNEAGITISVGCTTSTLNDDYNFFNHLALSSEKMHVIKQSGKDHALFNDEIIE
ncbi:MAG: GGDEF domain-containing protein, partial [Bacilli bacterium]